MSNPIPPTPRKTIDTIPRSQLPPVSLERPLKLFGETFVVDISTPLTLSPIMVQEIIGLPMTVPQFMGILKSRRSDAQVTVLKKLMRMLKWPSDTLWRSVTGKNKPSETTRKLVKQMLVPLLTSDVLDAALDGKKTALPWQSDWETVQQSLELRRVHGVLGKLGITVEGDFYQLVARLAELDRVASSVRQLFQQGLLAERDALLEQHIGCPVERWWQCSPNLDSSVARLVDISLQTLAWLEWRGVPKSSVDGASASASQLSQLLAPGKNPIGHWLLKMQKSAGCDNLRQFSALMMAKGIRRHKYYVSRDLLKKWSSGQQLIPAEAGVIVLNAVSGHVNAVREWRCFATARFLSFLCDVVIAGTRGEPPSWAAAQDQISRRYRELYELEAARRVAC